jgi:hypothetical protein
MSIDFIPWILASVSQPFSVPLSQSELFQQQLRHILACIALRDPEVGYVQGTFRNISEKLLVIIHSPQA